MGGLSWPFARLTIDNEGVTLEPSARLLKRLVRSSRFRWSEIREVRRLVWYFPFKIVGLEFQAKNSPPGPWVFWSYAPDQIIPLLRSHGVEIN
jgi:hypothetical protein